MNDCPFWRGRRVIYLGMSVLCRVAKAGVSHKSQEEGDLSKTEVGSAVSGDFVLGAALNAAWHSTNQSSYALLLMDRSDGDCRERERENVVAWKRFIAACRGSAGGDPDKSQRSVSRLTF